MNFSVNQKTVQTIIAYGAIVFGVLTQALSAIHLPITASAILGTFGVLLHPATSITAPPPPAPPAATSPPKVDTTPGS